MVESVMDVVIDLKTGEIEIVYAETEDEACELCEDRATCDRDRLRPCQVWCG